MKGKLFDSCSYNNKDAKHKVDQIILGANLKHAMITERASDSC